MSALEAWKANERFRLSGRRQDDLEEFGRTANPTGRINVPVTNPYTDTASDTEYDVAPAGGSLLMPGLPDWPMDTTFGYPSLTPPTRTTPPQTPSVPGLLRAEPKAQRIRQGSPRKPRQPLVMHPRGNRSR
jgi:hypothetical protein